VATTDLFTRLGHLRDLPNISFPELDDNFFNRVQPESFIKRKEREARKKQEEEEEKYNPSSEDFQPSYRTETPRPHTDSYQPPSRGDDSKEDQKSDNEVDDFVAGIVKNENPENLPAPVNDFDQPMPYED
jgi:hypothetical protein